MSKGFSSKASNAKNVPGGGKPAVAKAGTQPSGSPGAKFAARGTTGAGGGEFKVNTAGTMPGGSPGREYSNRSGGEYAQVTAGRK